MPTYTHKYSIAALPREDMGSDEEVIKEIHVRIQTSDGTYKDNRPFVHTFTEFAAPFTPIGELDKVTILGWIPANCKAEWEAAMERRVAIIAAGAAANARDDVPAELA